MESAKPMRVVSFASLTMAILQSICAAILTVSGIRVAIGLTALAAGAVYGPVLQFHQDAIRIPMLILATAGAIVNLLVLAWIWRLRSQALGAVAAPRNQRKGTAVGASASGSGAGDLAPGRA